MKLSTSSNSGLRLSCTPFVVTRITGNKAIESLECVTIEPSRDLSFTETFMLTHLRDAVEAKGGVTPDFEESWDEYSKAISGLTKELATTVGFKDVTVSRGDIKMLRKELAKRTHTSLSKAGRWSSQVGPEEIFQIKYCANPKKTIVVTSKDDQETPDNPRSGGIATWLRHKLLLGGSGT